MSSRRPGDRIDRYVVENILGRGGMGEVYEASDTRLGRRVALKVLRKDADPAANQRMLREARAAAALEHPNAVVVYDVGEAEGETFLAMELVRGKPLRSFVGDGDTPLERRLRWLIDVARALGAAHRAGIVHRDVKPDNVMVRADGAIKVLDFGIARRESRPVDPSAPTSLDSEPLGTLTEAGAIVGTPRYASPEQLRGEPVDGGTDQFAWGILAYELIGGTPPWVSRDGVQLISQILSAPPPPLQPIGGELPPAVDRVITRALSKDRAARFPTIDEAADLLEPFAEAPVSSDHAGGSAAPRSKKKQTPAVRVARGTMRAFFYVAAALGTLFIVAIVAGALQGNLKIDLGDDDEDAAASDSPIVIDGLTCGEATIEGPDPSGDMAAAIGVGACARLATSIGTAWRVQGGTHRLEVTASVAEPSRVTLRVAEREATAEARTPLEAVEKAVAELAPSFRGPPMSEATQRGWGANDEESARQIERAWVKTTLYVLQDDETAIRQLSKDFPDSPWPHALLALVVQRGGEESKAEIELALERLDILPSSRQKGLKGVLLFMRSADEREEALRLLRASYAEAPDDPDIAGLYAAVAAYDAPEEGFAVIDRLAKEFPTRSIVPLTNAMSSPEDVVLERDARYLQELHRILPESKAWWLTVRHHMLSGELDQARAALAFGDRLGQAQTAAGPGSDWMRAFVELVALRPTAARQLARSTLTDPRGLISAVGGRVTAAAYAMEGKMVNADSALTAEFVKQRDAKAPLHALRLAAADLRQRRRLGRRAPDPSRLDWIDATLEESAELTPDEIAYQLTELTLARGADAATGKAVLERIDNLARGDLPERRRQAVWLASLALVRSVRGDEAAIKLWRDTAGAPLPARIRAALDAALALDAARETEEAIAAYRLTIHPINAERSLEYVGARLRLANLLKKEGRGGEAADLMSQVAGVWKDADPELREAFLRLE